MSDLEPYGVPPETEPAATPAPEERYPFWGWGDLLIFAGLCVPSLALAGLLVRWILLLFPWRPSNHLLELLPSQFLGYVFLFLSLYVALKSKYHHPFWAALNWVYPKEGLARWAFSGVLLAIAVLLLGIVLKTPDIQMPFKDLMRDRLSFFLMSIFGSTMGPLFEELAFRGFLFPLVARSTGPVAGVLLTALPFAVLHGPQYGWSWRHLLLIGLAGSMFGWVRYKTGSTAASAVMHATYNLVFFLLYFIGKEITTW